MGKLARVKVKTKQVLYRILLVEIKVKRAENVHLLKSKIIQKIEP